MKSMGTVISQQPAQCIPNLVYYSTIPQDVLNLFLPPYYKKNTNDDQRFNEQIRMFS